MNDNKSNNNEQLNQHPKGSFEQDTPVYSYSDLLKANRRNFIPDGFDYDADTFENLIDSYATQDEIKMVLSMKSGHKVDEPELDKFCRLLYGFDFRETYRILSGISNIHMKKIIKNLGASGNATALSLTSRYLMKMEEDDKKDAINIRILNDLDDKK